jgi:hypothetical protein
LTYFSWSQRSNSVNCQFLVLQSIFNTPLKQPLLGQSLENSDSFNFSQYQLNSAITNNSTSYLHILHNPISRRGPFVMAHAIIIVLVPHEIRKHVSTLLNSSIARIISQYLKSQQRTAPSTLTVHLTLRDILNMSILNLKVNLKS